MSQNKLFYFGSATLLALVVALPANAMKVWILFVLGYVGAMTFEEVPEELAYVFPNQVDNVEVANEQFGEVIDPKEEL